jgi:peroxiredoxin
MGSEEVQGVNCTVMEIAMDNGVSERLWIDKATHLVRRDMVDEGGLKQETVFTAVRLGAAMANDLFRYNPTATKARNRIQLAQKAAETLIGKAAPDFSLQDLDGRTVDLSALRGKPVLLDFWATWCGYCREALPFIELLHRDMKDKVAVIGIDNEDSELARDFLQAHGYSLPSLVDRKDEAVNGYHVIGWPTTVLINRDGKIVYYAQDFTPEKLHDALQSIGVWSEN